MMFYSQSISFVTNDLPFKGYYSKFLFRLFPCSRYVGQTDNKMCFWKFKDYAAGENEFQKAILVQRSYSRSNGYQPWCPLKGHHKMSNHAKYKVSFYTPSKQSLGGGYIGITLFVCLYVCSHLVWAITSFSLSNLNILHNCCPWPKGVSWPWTKVKSQRSRSQLNTHSLNLCPGHNSSLQYFTQLLSIV